MPESERLPAIPDSEQTEAQRRAAAALIAGRRGALFGPFIPLMRSPELLERAQRLGEFLRYDCSLPERLRELAILSTARHFRQGYEWHVHAPAAAAAGLSAAHIAAIGAGEQPQDLAADESAVYEFCTQLHRTHAVSDAAYHAALTLVGPSGVVELAALCGYYGLLALVMNVARTALPPGARVPWQER